MYRNALLCIILPIIAGLACAEDSPEPPFQDGVDMIVNGAPWLRTVVLPFDRNNAEHTYKVYAHVYDFEGAAPITKGPGGLYTHHRGMFIGWTDTMVEGTDYDTWSMGNSYQQHVAWLQFGSEGNAVKQVERIEWRDLDDKTFIDEIRTIAASTGENGIRILDFTSLLTSLRGTIELKGNVQHAGMHIRMANEVNDHQDTTQYILPDGAERQKDDAVTGGWWVCCSMVVRDKRYWILHMTPPNHPAGQPVYSVRAYARFGAFTEPTLEAGKPLNLTYRIAVNNRELDRAACQALYDQYASLHQ